LDFTLVLRNRSCYNLPMTLIRRFRVYDLPTAAHDKLLRSAREIFDADVSMTPPGRSSRSDRG
jgi:hypothetical protein